MDSRLPGTDGSGFEDSRLIGTDGTLDSYGNDDGYGATGGSFSYDKGQSPVPSYGGGPYGLPPPPRPTYFHTVSLGLLVLMPAVNFVTVSLVLTFFYHRAPLFCWSLSGFFLSVSFLFMLARPVRDGPRYWLNLGCLCCVAVAAANLAGFWNMYRRLNTYWAYEGQRTYANVEPAELALTHLDGGKLLFSSDAHVDVSAAVGLSAGDRFCVAPIVGKARSSKVEHWATGINCCGVDGHGFSCGEVANRYARAGLVLLDVSGPQAEALAMFRRAAAEAGAAHGAAPSKDSLFVAWVEDPDVAQQVFWSDGIHFVVMSSLIYLLGSGVIGVSFHFGRRSGPTKAKLESRMM